MTKPILIAVFSLLILQACSGRAQSPAKSVALEESVAKAREKASHNDYQGALLELDKAIEAQPEAPKLYLMRGYSKFQLQDWSGAITDYDRYLQTHPDSADVHSKKGEALAMTDNLDDALLEFDKAIELSPDEAGYYQNKANLLGMKKQFKAAIEECDVALKLSPSPEIYSNRGVFKQENGDIEGAIADFTTAIEMDPTTGATYLERARCYALLGRDEEAEADLRKAKQFLGK